LNGGQFGVLLRQIATLDLAGVAQHVLMNFSVATQRALLADKVPIEFTWASYPYDAETIDDLFTFAAKHWKRFRRAVGGPE
jgi:hypothetical protein